MKCDDTRKVLEDLYEGLLDERTAAEARAHLAECGACRREAAAIEKLNSALVAVKVVAAPRGVADRTLEAVHGAAVAAREKTRRLRTFVYEGLAAAALIAACLGIFGWRPAPPVQVEKSLWRDAVNASTPYYEKAATYARGLVPEVRVPEIGLYVKIALFALGAIAAVIAAVQAHESKRLEAKFARYLR